MPASRRFRLSLCLSAILGLAIAAPSRAQEVADDMVGQTPLSWQIWKAATDAATRGDEAEVGKQLDQLASLKLSDLRLAQMADRTGSIVIEEMAKTGHAPASLKETVAKIENGRKQKAMAEDGWHFAAIGRFNYADANFKALIDSSPDPVALLEIARQNPNRHTILIKLISNSDVGPSAKRFLELLGRGEDMLRMDANEIVGNINRLSGPPRMSFNAANRLKVSGEYAVPHLLQFLQDPKQQKLHAAIIQLLPEMGRSALNPLCVALSMNDNVIRQVACGAITKMGYKQPLPYLAKLAADESASGEARASAKQAMTALGAATGDVAKLFYDLADAYYDNNESLKADPRKDTANVWYLRGNELRVIEVPTAIFNDVMAMRCCEEALKVRADMADATALWLAANFRREAKLGLDVESDKPDALADKDGTRPENYPRAIYFARAAGAKYNHMVLARAFKDKDPGVALGAIAALSETAGGPSLVGVEDAKQPLVQTLAFPNKQVRIKAALALGRALPKQGFVGAENVVPVLGEALTQAERPAALVVDPDDESANKLQAAMRSAGFDCAAGSNLHQARNEASKANISSYDVIFLASDIKQPDVMQAVGDLRHDSNTAATPILILTKAGQIGKATNASRLAPGVEVLLADVTEMGDPEKVKQQLMARVDRASRALGMTPLSPEASMNLALQAADVVKQIAESHSKVLDASRAAGPLMVAMGSKVEALRVKAAAALALIGNADAQKTIAQAALNAEHAPPERLAAFASLADSARHNGNLLDNNELVSKLIDFTMNEKDLVLRAAGSKALGALNLSSNKASEIIRAQHRG